MLNSLTHLEPLLPETNETCVLLDDDYRMYQTLVLARRVIEQTVMDEDEKANLLFGLAEVFHFLHASAQTRVQEIDGRNN